MILMLASHVIRYIKSRHIATRISYDLPVICFQKIYKRLNMFLTAPLSRYMKNQVKVWFQMVKQFLRWWNLFSFNGCPGQWWCRRTMWTKQWRSWTASWQERACLRGGGNMEMWQYDPEHSLSRTTYRWRGTRYYEKPTRARQRVNYEKCTAIYNEDMSNKVYPVHNMHMQCL